jgi:hypothetical protein
MAAAPGRTGGKTNQSSAAPERRVPAERQQWGDGSEGGP